MVDYYELRKAILLEVGFYVLAYPARNALASRVQGEGLTWLRLAIDRLLPTYLANERSWRTEHPALAAIVDAQLRGPHRR